LVIWEKVEDIPSSWNDLAVLHDTFLSLSYLCVLEKAPPKGMQHLLVGVYKAEQFVGCILVQTVEISLSKTFRTYFEKEEESYLYRYIKKAIFKPFKLKLLVGGNLMLTGEHTYCFNPLHVSETQMIRLLHFAIQKVKQEIYPSDAILLKDFFEHRSYNFNLLKENNYQCFHVEPNMILHLRPEWNTFSDYIASMKKKYRARYRTSKNKAQKITKKTLSYDEISAQNDEIYQLYKNISDKAKFNTFVLHESYFKEMKYQLKNKFHLTGYYLDHQLIGFFSMIFHEKTIFAHFLGYSLLNNQKYQLYLNMLYDMAKIGIEVGMRKIIYARTALEIKSSIGAIAYPMQLWLKHRYSIINKTIPWAFNFLNTENHQWKQRHPFKE